MRASFPVSIAAIVLVCCAPEQDSNGSGPPTAAPADEGGRAANAVNTAPAPVAAPDEDDIPLLTPEGWGPLRIGMTLAEVTAAAGPDADPDAVGGPEPEQCDQFRPARAPQGMLVMIEEGRLTRISLSGLAKVKTEKGLGVGDSEAAVRAAYGDAVIARPHEYLHPLGGYLTAWATGGTSEPYVRSPQARGIRYEIGEDGKVELIHAGGPAIQYVEGCL